jgi:hypothetical protein
MPAGPVLLTKQGAFDADLMNAVNAYFTGVQLSTIGQNAPESYNTSNFVSLLVNGAVPIGPPLVPAIYQINKAGVLADTLAAPVAGAANDDGKVIWIVSNTANAHTVTATGLYQSGSASVNLATFAAFAGAGMQLMAFNAKWVVMSSVGVTFT